MLFEARQRGGGFLLDELLGRLSDQLVLVGQLLRREHGLGARRLDEPRAAFRQGRGSSAWSHGYILSKMPAAPMPPPTHILTRPYRAFRRRISYKIVVV